MSEVTIFASGGARTVLSDNVSGNNLNVVTQGANGSANMVEVNGRRTQWTEGDGQIFTRPAAPVPVPESVKITSVGPYGSARGAVINGNLEVNSHGTFDASGIVVTGKAVFRNSA